MIDLDAQAESVVEFKAQRVKPDVCFAGKIVDTKKADEEDKKYLLLQVRALDENGQTTSVNMSQFMALPFAWSEDHKFATDKKALRREETKALYQMAGLFPDEVRPPVANRELQTYENADGEELSKEEYFAERGQMVKAAKKKIVELWRSAATELTDTEVFVKTRGYTTNAGEEKTVIDSLFLSAPEDEEIISEDFYVE